MTHGKKGSLAESHPIHLQILSKGQLLMCKACCAAAREEEVRILWWHRLSHMRDLCWHWSQACSHFWSTGTQQQWQPDVKQQEAAERVPPHPGQWQWAVLRPIIPSQGLAPRSVWDVLRHWQGHVHSLPVHRQGPGHRA